MSKVVSPILGLVLLGLVPTLAAAQTASILPNARTQFINANGQPVVGGTVTFYVPSTTTPKTTWQDPGETTPNSDPVTLDGLGSALIWGDGSYREVVKDSSGNLIWDAVTTSASGGGSGITSLNGQTGAVNIIGGTGITVTASGGNITLVSAGGNVTQTPVISNLRALTSAIIPVVVVQNYAVSGDYGGGVFTYNPSDTTTADNGCTIFVDAGSHRWYRQTGAAPVDFRWCGAKGDGTTDDTASLRAAIAVGPAVFGAPGNYKITGSLALKPNESLIGSGLNTTTITAVKNGTPYPAITTTAVTTSPSSLGPCDSSSNYVYSLCNITVSGFTLNTSGSTPVAGDDGISFFQYVNNATISNMYIENQWNGLTLGPADASFVNNVVSSGNYNNGLDISNSTYSGLQWNLDTVFLINNESDGLFSHVNVGSGFVGLYVFGGAPVPLTQVTLGSWTNVNTFANAVHGISAIGNSTGPVPEQGIRVIKGFFGQDGSDEIYLDTYNTGGGGLIIEPNYIELAGTGPTGRTMGHPATGIGSGVYTTASVGPIVIRGGVIKQNSYDGITSNGSSLVVDGGFISDNGVFAPASTMVNGFSYTIQSVGTTNFTTFGASANTIGIVFTKTGGTASGTGLVSTTGRSNGIFITSGAAGGVAINGVQAGNTDGGTSQLYGVASDEDFIAISGSNLLNNTTAPVVGTAMANSVASGNLPISINTGSGGGSFCALSGCTMSGPINMGGQNITNIAAITTTGNATVGGNLGVTGTSTLTGVVGTPAGIDLAGAQISSTSGSGISVDNITANNAIVVGSPTGGFQSGSLNAATAVLVNNVGIAVGSFCSLTGCTMSGPLIVNSTLQAQSVGIDQAPDGTLGHITGPSSGLSFAGGVNVAFTGSTATVGTIQAGTGFYGAGTATVSGVTTVTASGQVQGQDLFATRSAGIQTSPSGTAGRLDAGALSFFPQGINAGTASSFGSAFHGGVAIPDGGMTFTTAVSGNGLTVDNIGARVSVGIGASASGTTGDLAVTNAIIVGSPTGSYQANSINVASSLLQNNVGVAVGSFLPLTGGTMSGNIAMGSNNISGAADVSSATLHVSGSSALHSTIISSGGLNVTGGTTTDNEEVVTSLGVGVGASGTAGQEVVNSALIVGSPTGGYQANSVNVAGSLLVNNVGSAIGSFCALSGCTMSGNIAMGTNNISGVGTLTASVVAASDLNATTMLGTLNMNTHNIANAGDTEVNSLGVGVGPPGTSGEIAATGDITSATLHVTGSSALHSTIIVSGGLNVTGGTTTDNEEVVTSLGVGTGSSGIAGQEVITSALIIGSPTGSYIAGALNAAVGVYLNNSAYTNP